MKVTFLYGVIHLVLREKYLPPATPLNGFDKPTCKMGLVWNRNNYGWMPFLS